jgi:hypothetical protein
MIFISCGETEKSPLSNSKKNSVNNGVVIINKPNVPPIININKIQPVETTYITEQPTEKQSNEAQPKKQSNEVISEPHQEAPVNTTSTSSSSSGGVINTTTENGDSISIHVPTVMQPIKF